MIEFSCCSRYALCDYGRKDCLYVEVDPTATERCRCYKLKRKEANRSITDFISKEESPVKTEEPEETSLEQLSLF